MLWFKEYLTKLKDNGVSIMMASHAIGELQDYITDYAILNNGSFVKKGKFNNNMEDGENRFKLIYNDNIKDIEKKFIELDNISIVDSEKGNNNIFVITTPISYKELTGVLYEKNIVPDNISEDKKSLEDIFIETVQ